MRRTTDDNAQPGWDGETGMAVDSLVPFASQHCSAQLDHPDWPPLTQDVHDLGMTITQRGEHPRIAAIAHDQPDHEGRRAEMRRQVQVVIVLGDDREVVRTGVGPDGMVVRAGQVEQIDLTRPRIHRLQ